MMILFVLFLLAYIAGFFVKQQLAQISPRLHSYILYATIVVGLMWLNPWIHNSAGERTYYQNPIFGGEGVIFEPGYHMVGPFTRSQAWPDVMVTDFDQDNQVRIAFNDGTGANAQANVRWNLPRSEKDMIALHKAYRTVDNLEKGVLEPFAKECLGFASQLMESETHYSGGQSKFKEDFRDQLLNGQYVLETKVDFQMDTVTGEQIKTTTAHLRVSDTGVPIRIPSDVQTYGIQAAFAAVPQVTYDSIVYKRLTAKVEQATAESISKQRLITAQQQALTAKAEGEKRIADVRAEELALKEEAVIQAQKEKEVAKELALKAKFDAEKTLTEGRALAEANRLKVSAGLTPLERATFEKETRIGVAEALSKVQFPSTMIIGGQNGNGAINPFDILGLDAYERLSARLSGKRED